jgi:hypothetical protein
VNGEPTRHRPTLEFLEQARLADAGFAAEIDRLPRSGRQAAVQHAIELRKLRAPADERPAERLRLVTHAGQAPGGDWLGLPLDPAELQTKRSGNRRRTASEIRISPFAA